MMNLDQLIEAERNAPAEPTVRERRTVWTSIERSTIAAPLLLPAAGKLSPLAKFGTLLSTTTGKVVLATALVAGGTAGALNIPPPPTAPAAKVEKTAPPPRAASAKPKSRTPKGKARAAAVASAPTPPAVQESSVVPIQRPKGKAAPESPPKRSPVALLDPMAPAPPLEPEPEPEPEPEVVDDSAGKGVLARAERALQQNKPEVALTLLRVHRKMFPEGPSAERREAMFVKALCLGGMSLGPKARWDFNRKWPKSKHRGALREFCSRDHSQ